MIRRIGKMITGLTIPSPYYLSLITEFAPRPITNDLELSIIQERINTILDQKNLSQDDRDYINVLGIFEQEQTILDILDGKRQLNSQETFKLR
jgi:HTH-type transcriptional regulator/antitoxin HigA